MSYNNLREFIERLEREGELVRVAAEVSPVEEIAELTDRMAKQPGGGKAILFERTGTDFPVATNLMGSERRMALALGVESLDALTRRIDALLHEVTTPKATLWEKLRMLPPPQGLGLGLPLCQAIARGHGGRLLLQSGPEGTTVTVSLPDRRCTKTVLREPPFAYGGGFHPVLLGLADALPYTAFTRKNLD